MTDAMAPSAKITMAIANGVVLLVTWLSTAAPRSAPPAIRPAPVNDEAVPASSPIGSSAAVFRFGMRNMNDDNVSARTGKYNQMIGCPPAAIEMTQSIRAVGIRSA